MPTISEELQLFNIKARAVLFYRDFVFPGDDKVSPYYI